MTEVSANPNGINQGFIDHFARNKVQVIDFPNETLLKTRLDLTLVRLAEVLSKSFGLL